MSNNFLNTTMNFISNSSNNVSAHKATTQQVSQKSVASPAKSLQTQNAEQNVNQAILSDKISLKKDLKLNARLDLDKGFKGYLSVEKQEEQQPQKQSISKEENLKNQSYIKFNQRNLNIPKKNSVAQSSNNNVHSNSPETSATTKKTIETTQKKEELQLNKSLNSENKMTESKKLLFLRRLKD